MDHIGLESYCYAADLEDANIAVSRFGCGGFKEIYGFVTGSRQDLPAAAVARLVKIVKKRRISPTPTVEKRKSAMPKNKIKPPSTNFPPEFNSRHHGEQWPVFDGTACWMIDLDSLWDIWGRPIFACGRGKQRAKILESIAQDLATPPTGQNPPCSANRSRFHGVKCSGAGAGSGAGSGVHLKSRLSKGGCSENSPPRGNSQRERTRGILSLAGTVTLFLSLGVGLGLILTQEMDMMRLLRRMLAQVIFAPSPQLKVARSSSAGQYQDVYRPDPALTDDSLPPLDEPAMISEHAPPEVPEIPSSPESLTVVRPIYGDTETTENIAVTPPPEIQGPTLSKDLITDIPPPQPSNAADLQTHAPQNQAPAPKVNSELETQHAKSVTTSQKTSTAYQKMVFEGIRVQNQDQKVDVKFSIRNLTVHKKSGRIYAVARYKLQDGRIVSRTAPEGIQVAEDGKAKNPEAGITFAINTLVYKALDFGPQSGEVLDVKLVAISDDGTEASTSLALLAL